MKKIICGIEVDVIRKNVKAIRIKIDREGLVSLIIPNRCSEKAGVDFFMSKFKWVISKLENKTVKREVDFSEGEEVYILGNKYVLKRNTVGNDWKILDNTLFLNARTNFKSAYEKVLKEVLLLRSEIYFDKWERLTGLEKKGLSVRKTKSKWGSCNFATKEISLSLYLACLPEFCLDYVVLHEVCHLRYANHGEGFKRALDKFMPNWKQIRKFMKEKSNLYLYKE